MSMTLRVVVPPHPLISHWLTMLRDSSTPKPLYETGLEQLGKWLTYEALRDWLPHREEKINTNNGITNGKVIESRAPLIAVTDLPGGIGLWQGARSILPISQLCLGGIPQSITENSGVIIFIDQISDGNKLLHHLNALKEKKVNSGKSEVQ